MVDQKEHAEQVNYKYIVTTISIALVVGLTLIFTLGRYSLNQMNKATEEAKAQKRVLDEATTRLSNLKQLSSKAEELKTKNATVLKALPQDKDISALFVQFEKIGQESNVNVKSVSESQASTEGTASQIVRSAGYGLDGQAANYGSLKTALSKLETNLRILSTSKLNISGTSGGPLSVQFSITTFLRGE